jgi:hypothetical protein
MLQEFLIAIESDWSCYPPKTLLITDNTHNAVAFTDCKLHLYVCVRACVSSNHSGGQSAR